MIKTGGDDRKVGRGLSGPTIVNADSERIKAQGKLEARSLSRPSVPIEWFGMRARVVVVASVCALVLGFVIWHLRSGKPGNQAAAPATLANAITEPSGPLTTDDSAPTAIYAHNLMLRRGPDFRIYVRWLRGEMIRTRRDVNPRFDDPESFSLEIKTGVIRANIGDIGNFLNAGGVANSPLKNITLLADGDQIKLKGTLHKLIPLPVELLGGVTVNRGQSDSTARYKTECPENSIEGASWRIAHQLSGPLSA